MYFLNCIPVVETCGLSIYHSISRKLAERTDFKRFLNNNEVHNGFKSYLFHPKKIEQSQPACSQWSLTLGLRSHYRIELFGAGERECGSPLRSAPLPGCSCDSHLGCKPQCSRSGIIAILHLLETKLVVLQASNF